MSIRIKNKDGIETEYIRPEKLSYSEPEKEAPTVKKKDGTTVEYVHSSQVGKEEMSRLLRQAEIRETIARNEKIKKHVEKRLCKEEERAEKKKATAKEKQKRLNFQQNRVARSTSIHEDWLGNITAVQYLGAEVIEGGTTIKLKMGSAICRSLIGSAFGTLGAILGAATAKQEIKQIPNKTVYHFFVLYKDGSSNTIAVNRDTKEFHDLMALSMKSRQSSEGFD